MHICPEQRRIELLAPAGNMECLHAAVTAGADAVYLGLDQLNARRNADNFTLETLPGVCEYAHLRGVRIYITLNVAILPSELEAALQLARGALNAGADAFIVQDIGLASLLGKALPEARLHISTQMNTHNAAGIEFAWQLGAKRVTLARELSLPEIAELSAVAASFGMEVETFAHGALCICYSGQCLMSSMIGGRSANRGLCAQACRLPYELHREGKDDALPADGEHLLSPRDLCSIDLLDDLAQAGVSSLKIEGRMKSADYVYEVVSVYREVLDSGLPATEEHKARLAEAFSRGFTTAYLEGKRGNDIMSYGRPNNRGVFVGRVARVTGDCAEITPETEIHEGDVLEFWTNRGHFAETVSDATLRKGTVRVDVSQRVGKGDRVFRVRNAATAFVDDSCAPRVKVTGSVSLEIGKPALVRFEAVARDGRVCSAQVEGDLVEAARTKAISVQDVVDHVDRMGQTPFELADGADSLSVTLDDNVGMSFSQLHHLRADALETLKRSLLEPFGVEPVGAIETPALLAGRRFDKCEVVAWATNPACARAAKRAGADAVYVPVLNYRRGQSALCGVRQDVADQAGYPSKCVMAFSAVDHDPVYPAREACFEFDPWDYAKEGKVVFADSMASVVRALSLGARVEVGPHVPVTNAASVDLLARMGVSRVWLSPELTLGQIDDIARASSLPLGLTVVGKQELMITEHCLLMSQGPCNEQCETCPRRAAAHYFTDRKGFDFPVVTDMFGRGHLYNGIELDAVPCLPDLLDIGISAVMVDTTFMDKKAASDSVGRALRARDLAMSEHRAVAKRPNTTTGHLFRGVS